MKKRAMKSFALYEVLRPLFASVELVELGLIVSDVFSKASKVDLAHRPNDWSTARVTACFASMAFPTRHMTRASTCCVEKKKTENGQQSDLFDK